MRLTGTWSLTRLLLRRSWLMISATVLTLFLLVYGSVVATIDLYPDAQSRLVAARAANASPAVIGMYGRIYDQTSLGGIGAAKLTMICYIALAILAIAIVRRATRAEEESGRIELLGSTVMGHRAPLAAGVLVATGTSLLTGLLIALACGYGGFDWPGSWVAGASVAAAGINWTGITAICVQLSASNRVCGAWAFGSLGGAFLLRMLGDLQDGHVVGTVLQWLGPLGWSQQARPFGGDRWWVFIVPALFFVACLVLADRLREHRDLGSGIVPDRPGLAHTSMGSALALAWRLQRGMVMSATAGFVLLGLVMGSMMDGLDGFLTKDAVTFLQQIGGAGDARDLYVTSMAAFMGLVACCFCIASVQQLRSQESAGQAEMLLATPATRLAYIWSHGVIALGAAVLLPVSMGVALGLSDAAISGTFDHFGGDLSGFAVQVPAVLLLTALALALFGWVPRATGSAWGFLGIFAVLGQFGDLLSLPDWLMQLSPFHHIPRVPAERFDAVPVLVLLGIAVVLLAGAATGFRRRDLKG